MSQIRIECDGEDITCLARDWSIRNDIQSGASATFTFPDVEDIGFRVGAAIDIFWAEEVWGWRRLVRRLLFRPTYDLVPQSRQTIVRVTRTTSGQEVETENESAFLSNRTIHTGDLP